MTKNEDSEVDSINVLDALIPNTDAIYEYVTEEQLFFQFPIFWIEHDKSISKLENHIIEETELNSQSTVITSIVEKITEQYESAKQEYIENERSVGIECGENTYNDEEWDDIIHRYLDEEWNQYLRDKAYSERESSFFWEVREVDGEYRFTEKGCFTVLAILGGILLLLAGFAQVAGTLIMKLFN